MLRVNSWLVAASSQIVLFALVVLLLTPHAFALTQTEYSAEIKEALSKPECNQSALSPDQVANVSAAYQENAYSPVWTFGESQTEVATVLLSELQRSTAHGLNPEFYRYKTIKSLSENSDLTSLACMEVLLSRAFVLYANDIGNGHIRADQHPDHTIVTPVIYTPGDLLSEARSRDNLRKFLQSLLTTDDRYVRLISKLAEFLRIQSRNAWPEIRNLGSSDNPAVDPDKVRELLLFTGDLDQKQFSAASKDSKEYSGAVARFQIRHGIDPSGKVDFSTFREMALPLARRIELIRINLERRRWQNHDLGPNHIYINIADQSVRFVRGGKKSGSARLAANRGIGDLPTFAGKVIGVNLNTDKQLVLEVVSDTESGFFGGSPEYSFVLGGDAHRNVRHLMGDKAASSINLETSSRVQMQRPITIYVTYLTVWANKDGSINFRPDQLKRDRSVAKLLGLVEG